MQNKSPRIASEKKRYTRHTWMGDHSCNIISLFSLSVSEWIHRSGCVGFVLSIHTFRFFVISGFLVAMILRKNDHLDVSSIGLFYYRR
ncbi:hypothetical protein ANCDUO_00387 [Ancylostoma duodenale]|uniref:Uncharacterized protein n=1 Tax=Ancylostoma duodenale TaxID=51022 RepID=A0A0C2E1L5_9BILA|nr:hypothetical protein ANCDUO_00387 [Ancylostoma duodenale]